MSVKIHRGHKSIRTDAEPYVEYDEKQIAEKQAAAELERQFYYNSYVPTRLSFDERVINEESLIAMLKKMTDTKTYSIQQHAKEFHLMPNKMDLYHVYIKAVKGNKLPRDIALEKSLRTNKGRSDSGVLVFTLVMSDRPNGNTFTCRYNCSYCPNVPNMARSYIPAEPAVARGDQFNWDPVAQIFNRFKSYLVTGQIDLLPDVVQLDGNQPNANPPDTNRPNQPADQSIKVCPPIIKGEFILEGGTFSNYPDDYCDWFMTMLYYAGNVIYDPLPRRQPLTLHEEQRINVNCVGVRVVGLSIETRPDMINAKLLRRLRNYGVTRVQIGVQHTDDEILRGVNRLCYDRHTKAAMRMLADNAFKIQIHLMPDLPGSSPEKDIQMFEKIFTDLDYVFDCIKCYPTMVVNFTEIKKLYDAGHYKPYGDDNEVMMQVLMRMTKLLVDNRLTRVRIERIIRDIPSNDVEGGTSNTSMGDLLRVRCEKAGYPCCCIRCREVKDRGMTEQPTLVRSDRLCSGANEVFLSAELNNVLYGFLRLRLPEKITQCIFDEIKDCALIRELHVYGTSSAVRPSSIGGLSVSAVDSPAKKSSYVQSRGLGTKLLEEAKRIAAEAGFQHIAVISGVGVEAYYTARGFYNCGNYLCAKLF